MPFLLRWMCLIDRKGYHIHPFWRYILKIFKGAVAAALFFSLFVPNNWAEMPRVVKTFPLSQTAIQLQFDGRLEAETAENVANYRITPDIQIEDVLLDKRGTRVMLFTTPLAVGKAYTLTLAALQKGAELQTPPPGSQATTEIGVTLPMENEITFGAGETVTFSTLQDTSLIVAKDRKTRNHNAGAEPVLRCSATGGVFFVSFDLFDAFADIGIEEPAQVLEATLSLHAQQCEGTQTVLIRRVLLPWREGRGTSSPAEDNELTYNSALHRNLPWNKPPAQAMLPGINGDKESDYNGSEDVAHRVDSTAEIADAGKRYSWEGQHLTAAVRFWVANPDYNYGYLFAVQDENGEVVFASKEHADEPLRPVLTIRYRIK